MTDRSQVSVFRTIGPLVKVNPTNVFKIFLAIFLIYHEDSALKTLIPLIHTSIFIFLMISKVALLTSVFLPILCSTPRDTPETGCVLDLA